MVEVISYLVQIMERCVVVDVAVVNEQAMVYVKIISMDSILVKLDLIYRYNDFGMVTFTIGISHVNCFYCIVMMHVVVYIIIDSANDFIMDTNDLIII